MASPSLSSSSSSRSSASCRVSCWPSVNNAREKARLAAGMQFAASTYHGIGDRAVGIWDFEKGSGTTAEDSSGNGNNGAITGATWKSRNEDGNNTYGQQSKYSLYFDGSGDYVTLPASISSDIDNLITVGAWAYSDGFGQAGTYRGIVSEKYTGDGTVDFELYLTGANNTISIGFHKSSTWRKLESVVPFPIGKWTYIVGTYDGHYLKLYADGIQIGQSNDLNTTLPTGINGWYIGHRHDSGDVASMWKGFIDDVKIYGSTLTASEVGKLYAEGLSRHLAEK